MTDLARLRQLAPDLPALLNLLGIAGPNIPHHIQTEPDPKWSPEEMDVWRVTKDDPWCVCGRIWPCEAKAAGDTAAALLDEIESLRAIRDAALGLLLTVDNVCLDMETDAETPDQWLRDLVEAADEARVDLTPAALLEAEPLDPEGAAR